MNSPPLPKTTEGVTDLWDPFEHLSLTDDDDHTNTDYFKSPKPKSSAFSEQFEEPPITVKESPDSVVDKCLLASQELSSALFAGVKDSESSTLFTIEHTSAANASHSATRMRGETPPFIPKNSTYPSQSFGTKSHSLLEPLQRLPSPSAATSLGAPPGLAHDYRKTDLGDSYQNMLSESHSDKDQRRYVGSFRELEKGIDNIQQPQERLREQTFVPHVVPSDRSTSSYSSRERDEDYQMTYQSPLLPPRPTSAAASPSLYSASNLFSSSKPSRPSESHASSWSLHSQRVSEHVYSDDGNRQSPSPQLSPDRLGSSRSMFTSPTAASRERSLPFDLHQHQLARLATYSPKSRISTADGYLYEVQFKRSHRFYCVGNYGPQNLMKGDFVVVEADRGEDMGVVSARLAVEQYRIDQHTAGHRGKGFNVGQPTDNKMITRLATVEDLDAIPNKILEEEIILQVCREKSAQRQLQMTVVDVEFQFDGHKLTIFFEAHRRVDFRDLVSELFSLYKTRIWMAQVDTSTTTQQQEEGVALSMMSGFLLPPMERRRILMDYLEANPPLQENLLFSYPASTEPMATTLPVPSATNVFFPTGENRHRQQENLGASYLHPAVANNFPGTATPSANAESDNQSIYSAATQKSQQSPWEYDG